MCGFRISTFFSRASKIEPTRKLVAANDEAEALSLDQLAQLQPDDIFRRLPPTLSLPKPPRRLRTRKNRETS